MSEKAQILVVDDEEQMRSAMESVLARLGHVIFKANNGEEALEVLSRGKIDMIISDMRMPLMDGEELLRRVHEQYPQIPMVMITAYGTIGQAVEAMKNGALDFITKPFSAEDLEAAVDKALNPPKQAISSKSAPKVRTRAILTNDPEFKRLLEIAVTVAGSSASVLISGESGTGKELISRLIHTSSRRKDGPFVAVNCAALPDNLLESELFGHEKGSFTGALGLKIGKFELANGGTILLDEISEMDLTLQAKLLRVLQEREVDRVGGSKPIPIDVRVIGTTNRDIRRCVAEGKFREDLYYRLNVIPLNVPPLRERKSDIKLLIEHFVRQVSEDTPKKLAPGAMEALCNYSWPGNVRELVNACERAVLLGRGDMLEAEQFLMTSIQPRAITGDSNEELQLSAGMSVAEAEKRLIFETLRSTGDNRTKAAELLGISIRTLRNKLHEYGADDAGEGEE